MVKHGKRNEFSKEEISVRLRSEMERRRLSDSELARMAQIDRRTVADARKGSRISRRDSLVLIADALEITLEDLTGVKGNAAEMDGKAKSYFCH